MTSSVTAHCKLHEGKVAVVTGSTDGIGYSIARRLAQDGASVMICSRSQKHVDEAVKALLDEGLHVCGTVCNVLEKNDWKLLIDRTKEIFGGVDIFISNVGGIVQEVPGACGPMMETTEEGWDAMFQLNLKSGFFTAKEAAANMEDRGGGSIVFIAGIAAYLACCGCELFPGIGLLSVTKTAMLGLVQAMAPQCATKGIRVNAVAPGLIRTALGENIVRALPKSFDDYVNRCPMKRMGEPEEIAGMVSFLCSHDASYITGETVTVCGGFPTRL